MTLISSSASASEVKIVTETVVVDAPMLSAYLLVQVDLFVSLSN